MRRIIIAIILTLFAISLANAQTAKRITFKPCGDILTINGNLTAKKQRFLYVISLTKGQILKVRLDAKPKSKEIFINIYRNEAPTDYLFQPGIGQDYDIPIAETGDYSILVFANKKNAKFSLEVDVADGRWKC
jgi:hypothetical protein